MSPLPLDIADLCELVGLACDGPKASEKALMLLGAITAGLMRAGVSSERRAEIFRAPLAYLSAAPSGNSSTGGES